VLRPTKRFGAILVGAVLLFVIGTNIQSGWLLVLSSLLLASLVAGSLLPLRTLRRVEVERSAPLQAHQGDRVRVELDVANRDRRAKLPLLVEDDHCSAIRVMTPSLRNGEGVRLSTTRVARRRGVAESSAVRLSSSAPFGVAVARRSIGVAGRTVVYPAVIPLGGFPASWDAPSADRSTPGDPRRGLGAEYLGIREYRTGDSMRHVHWPSTARHGSVMVREFEQERAQSLTVVVDTLADVVPDASVERTPLDVCCAIAASASLAAVRSRRNVRLVAALGGELDVLDATDPGAILEWLARIGPGGGLPVGAVLERMDRELLGGASVLLAAPGWRANDAATLVPALAPHRGAASTLALVDARGFGGRPTARLLEGDGIEALRAGASNAGTFVFTVRPADDLASVLRSGLRVGR
jgi:uncharacterized protein (DUF58 family)